MLYREGKKQNMVCSNAKVEHRAMTHTTCEDIVVVVQRLRIVTNRLLF